MFVRICTKTSEQHRPTWSWQEKNIVAYLISVKLDISTNGSCFIETCYRLLLEMKTSTMKQSVSEVIKIKQTACSLDLFGQDRSRIINHPTFENLELYSLDSLKSNDNNMKDKIRATFTGSIHRHVEPASFEYRLR